jgi:serine protease Do
VELGYLREGKPYTTSVSIADRAKLYANIGEPSDETAAPVQADAGEGKLGIKVTPVPASVASTLKIKGGVAISTVKPGSFADEINLTKGTIITEINKRPVPDEATYNSIVSGLKSGQDVVFTVRSPEATGLDWVSGTLP